MRILLFSFFAILLISGCSGVREIEIPTSETEGEWVSEMDGGVQPDRMYVRHKEAKYVVRDEPYSIASKKKDPELLGPQRTYTGTTSTTSKKTKKRTKASGMTKSSCISMIGQAKYDRYVKKYGGDAGAIRRCLILKRLRG